jgi:DNA/RNA endonuclease YhcR with UshA esterase domain
MLALIVPNARGSEGRFAHVRGVVQLYRDKAEIILNEPGQLRSPD